MVPCGPLAEYVPCGTKRNDQTADGGDDRVRNAEAETARPSPGAATKESGAVRTATAGAAGPARHSNAHAAHHLSAEISTRGLERNAGAGLAHPHASNMAHGYGVLHGCACQPQETVRRISGRDAPYVHQGAGTAPPRADLGGRSDLPSRRTSIALSSRSPSRQLSPKRGAERGDTERTSPHAASCTRSRDALCRAQAAARGLLDALPPRHSSHPTMTIMLTPAAKASTSATVCLSDVLFCSRAGSTSTVAT